MIKKFMYGLLVLSLLVIVKFFISSYSILYVLGDFKISEVAEDGTMYFEIEYEDSVYNFMFYNSRKMFKKRVRDVKVEEIDGNTCLTPVIKGFNSYTVCSDGESLFSKELISKKEDINISDDFKFYDNLNKNEYILLWKYDGFYYMNGEEQKSINIFDSDRYSNDLMYQKDKYLIFPKYGSDYLFSDFIVLDMTKGEYKTISSDYKINYSSKVVGEHGNSIYIFDFTSNKLYEVNYKKRRCKLVGDQIKGYIKYQDGRKKSASLDDYVKNNYTFFKVDDKNISVSDNYFSYKENSELKIKYSLESDVKFIDSYEDNLYYISDDNIYRYTRNGVELLVHYFEFNFNNGNIVFVYNK